MTGLEAVRRDVAHALRLLRRSPGFAVAVITVLALAIGANVTVFTLANAFLFKNLPFDDSDRIVYVGSRTAGRPGTRGVSYPDYLDFRAQTVSLEGAGALTTGTVDLSDGTGMPERYRSASVTAGAFATAGQRPALGREFHPDDERPGTPGVAIIGDALWRARYGRDPGIVGRTIRVNDATTTVVGVMAPGFTFPGATDLWLPLVRTPAMERRDARTLTMFGRMRPGHIPFGRVRAELTILAARLSAQYPATNKDVTVVVQNFNDRYNAGDTARLLSWLLWAVAFVLLIACANVANLLLARAVARSREISIRASVGATRADVMRQLLVESLMLAVAAGGVGLLLGLWGVRVFDAALVPAVKAAYIDFSVDLRVVAYLVVITGVTALLFGAAPALQLSRLDINAVLKDGGAAGQGRRARALSAALVVSEVALAVVLLTGAGLMIRSFVNTSRADIGIDPSNVLSLNVNLRRTKYPQRDDHVRFYEQLKARLEALPGVQTMAVASDLPAESPDDFFYEIEGAPPDDARTRHRAAGLYVGEDYFAALGLRPGSGREFTKGDTAPAPRVAIVNDSFARRAWPARDAVGKRFRLVEFDQTGRHADGPWFTVCGLVPDVLQDDESFELSPVIYLSYRQSPVSVMEVIVRTRVAAASVGETIRREVQALDPDLAVRTLRPLEESLRLRNWRYRVFGSMFAIFAAIALVLASVGLYAVLAHAVSQRTREIGVRRTLGASSGSILGLVFRQAMTRFGGGLLLGLAGALAATRVLASMLVGVSPADPLTLTAVSAVLALAAGLGCAVPAHSAVRVDPLVALRKD